jgi:O-antigen/teichoic acid export membrane protein
MISKKFIKSSFIYSVIGSLPLASAVLLLPFYTNLLTISDFGILALYISFSYLIQIIVNFALDTNIGVSYFEYNDNKEKLKEYIRTIVSLLLFIGVVFTILSFFVGNKIFSLVFSNNLQFFPYGFMSVITGIFNSFFKTYTNLLINRQMPNRFLLLNSINFILTISISIIGLYMYPYTLIGPMWGRLLSGVGIFVIALYLFIKEYGFGLKVVFLKGIYSFCIPMVVYFIMTWVLSYVDRFIINDYLSASDVGIFDFAVKCTLLIEFLQMGLSSSIFPKIFSIWKEKNILESTEAVNRYFNSFTAISILVIPVLIIVIPAIVPVIVTKKEYFLGLNYLGVLSLGFVFRGLYVMYLAPVYFLKKTKILPKVFIFSAIFQILITILFIRNFGLYGVVWANFISKQFQLIFLMFFCNKSFKISVNIRKQIILPLIYVLLVVVSEIFMIENYRLIFQITQMGIICSLVFWIYRKEIPLAVKPIIGMIIRKKC